MLIGQQGTRLPSDLVSCLYIQRPDVNLEEPDAFLESVHGWLRGAAEEPHPTLLAEPARLLAAGENRAAVISAISLLESVLRRRVDMPAVSSSRAVTLRELLHHAESQGLLRDTPIREVQDWLMIRNEVVHRTKNISKGKAEQIVSGVQAIAHANL